MVSEKVESRGKNLVVSTENLMDMKTVNLMAYQKESN